MILKEKKWWWKLTIFNADNYTLVGHTLYYPKGRPPTETMLKHEEVHLRQWQEVGCFTYYFLYLFCLPFFYNPWRRRWETEAYASTGTPQVTIDALLSSWRYGWV